MTHYELGVEIWVIMYWEWSYDALWVRSGAM